MSLLLLSLPQSAAPAGGDPHTQLKKWLVENLQTNESSVHELDVPSFKIGTLDNLVTQSEELAKIDSQFQSVVTKIGDSIDSIYNGNRAKIAASKKVDGNKTPEQYFGSFKWNTSKYRMDKPIPDLVDIISKEAFELDADVREAVTRYGSAKSNLNAVDRKQTGNLATRSLHDVVKRENFVQESEYLTTLLVAVPKSSKKEFLNKYETLTEYVVPRSAGIVAEDSEYILFNVTLFKRSVPKFNEQVRANKWTPREFQYSEDLITNLRKEQRVASEEEQKLYGEVTRLTKAAYSSVIEAWAHIKAIRTFVESVLRYGLPPNFLIVTIEPSKAKPADKAEKALIDKFGYLGGNAFQKDKRGKLKGDSDLHEYGALVDTEYKPFVLFHLDF